MVAGGVACTVLLLLLDTVTIELVGMTVVVSLVDTIEVVEVTVVVSLVDTIEVVAITVVVSVNNNTNLYINGKL